MDANVRDMLKAIKEDFDEAATPMEKARGQLWQAAFQSLFIYGETQLSISEALGIPPDEIDYGLSDMAEAVLTCIECGWGKLGAARLTGLTLEQIDQFLKENRD